jgi:hypothetical protein
VKRPNRFELRRRDELIEQRKARTKMYSYVALFIVLIIYFYWLVK